MYNDSGIGSGGIPYEYVVAEQSSTILTLKKIGLVALYVFWVLGWLILGGVIKLILPLLALIPVTLWMLVFFTWRLTQVAYEYSFFGGTLKVSRILGERSRRNLAEIKISSLSAVYPCNGEYDLEIRSFSADKVIFAASSKDAPGLMAALWKEEDGQKRILYFEMDDKAQRILRCYNSGALRMGKVKY